MENNILFRCSALGKLMTEPRAKAAKEAGELSETAKTWIEELWLRNEYGYYDEVITTPILKGIICESDSMALVQSVVGGEFRMKNKQLFQNEYIKGTPDIILSDAIEDIKTSYNISTFHFAELTTDYYWQGVGYCLLTGKTKFRLIYCLVDTPDEMITEAKKSVWFKFAGQEDNPDYIRISQQIEKNHKCSHIPEALRVKRFEFDVTPEMKDRLYAKIEQARKYYNTITL